jgi:N-acetylneuraminic acid mutarotase
MKKIMMLVVFMLLGVLTIGYAAVSPDYAPGTPNNFFVPKTTGGSASDLGWSTKAAHPTTRAHCMVSEVIDVGGVKKYYVFGGPTVSGGAYTTANYEYNTVTDAWTAKAAMPTARGIGRAVVVQGKIYVIGGCVTFGTGMSVVEIYDPATDAWTTGPSMLVGNHDFIAAAYKDTWVYVCGGGNWSAPPIATVYVLNTVTNTWSSATGMPVAVGTPGGGIVGNKIIVATGYIGAAGSNNVYVGTISPTDPTSITWTTGTVMPGEAVYRANSGVCGGKVYVCGGNLASGSISNAANKYDPASNTWTALPNKPTATSNVYGWAADATGKLYYPVGYNGSAYLSVHEMLDDQSYANDVGMDAMHYPTGSHTVNTAMIPKGRVKNYGSAAQSSFSVVCSILGTGGALRYTNTQTAPAMASGDTALITFTSWTPTVSENVTVVMKTLLAGDQNTNNDRMTRTTIIGSFMLYEDFNGTTFPATGWQAVILTGTYNWQRFTAGTYPTCAPYEGDAMAGYLSFSASAGYGARLISPAIIAPTATPCSLKFWMMHDPGYPSDLGPDSIRILTSPNGTTFTQVASFRRYEAVQAWTEHSVYLGTFTGNFYIAFEAYSQYGNNMYIDLARVIGPSGIEEGPNTRIQTTALNSVKPNPVKGIAHISFNIAEPTRADLRIYDASGRLVKTLVNSKLENGVYNLTWNGTDDNNRAVSEGIYFYTLETNHNNFTKKLVLTR